MFNIKQEVEKIKNDYQELEKTTTPGACWKLSTTLHETETTLREYIQHATKQEITHVISKLKAHQELAPEELDYVKLWIVGDAEYYTKIENNYNDWQEEVKRLMAEIQKTGSEQPGFVEAAKMRAMVLDAIRTLGDILFFLKEKERVSNFKEAMKEIDPGERALLIKLLQEKKDSPKF